MLKIACICLLMVVVVHSSVPSSSTAEKNAGEAIGKLLQEKISKKFRDAANEVKGVLVKHLGKSLKEAHSKMNPKPKARKMHGASIHHNKSGRNRKDGAQITQNGEGQGGFGVPGPGSPPGASGIPGPGGPGSPAAGPPGSPMMPQAPSAPGSPIGSPLPAVCGGTCPSTCAPSCDNTCCTGMQQACPSACIISCFSYCPSQCCRK